VVCAIHGLKSVAVYAKPTFVGSEYDIKRGVGEDRLSINSHGFRGKEFSIAKPDDVIRVLTLGASSTFGFFNKDDETYPYLLEQRLNKLCHGPKHFEDLRA